MKKPFVAALPLFTITWMSVVDGSLPPPKLGLPGMVAFLRFLGLPVWLGALSVAV